METALGESTLRNTFSNTCPSRKVNQAACSPEMRGAMDCAPLFLLPVMLCLLHYHLREAVHQKQLCPVVSCQRDPPTRLRIQVSIRPTPEDQRCSFFQRVTFPMPSKNPMSKFIFIRPYTWEKGISQEQRKCPHSQTKSAKT